MKLLEFLNVYVLTEAAIDRAIAANPILEPVLKRYFSDLKPKYFPWVINVIKDLGLFDPYENLRYLRDLKTTIDDFDKFSELNVIKNKDIGVYKDWDTLTKAVEEAKKRKEEIDIRKANKKNSAQKIYEDEQYLVMEPKNKEASCVYGKGSQWCISATQSKNYFQEYTEKGMKFLFLINKRNNDKDAIAWNPKIPLKTEIYDSQDQIIYPETIIEKYPPEVIQAVENHIGFKLESFNLESFISDPLTTINAFLGEPGNLEDYFVNSKISVEQIIETFIKIGNDINRLGETAGDNEIDEGDIRAMLTSFVFYNLFVPITHLFQEGTLNIPFVKLVEFYKAALRILEREGENFPERPINSFFADLFNKIRTNFTGNRSDQFYAKLKAFPKTKQFSNSFSNEQANTLDFIVQTYPGFDLNNVAHESNKKNRSTVSLKEFYKKELFD